MKEIIIFAGTCASGKTTVIEKIKKGELSFDNQIEIGESSNWDYCIQYKHYLEKIESNSLQSDRVVLHHDIYGERIMMQNNFELLSKLINNFDKVSLVTLTTSNSELKKRIIMRAIKTIGRMILNPKNFEKEAFRLKKHYQTYKNYSNPDTLKNLYDDWFNYVGTLKIDQHWILNSDRKNEYDVREAEEALVYNKLTHHYVYKLAQ